MGIINDAGYRPGEKTRAQGVRDAALIRKATMVAVAIANASDLISNYKKQRDIQDKALKISEEEKAHLKNVYWPRELEFLKEFTTEEDREQAEIYGRRFAGRLAASVAGKMAASTNRMKCEAARYCSSQYVRAMQSQYEAYANAVANAKVIGYITGFAHWHALNDRDYKRRHQAIGIGRGLMSVAANLYQAAGSGLAGKGQEISNLIGRAIEGYRTAEVNSINSVPDFERYLDGSMQMSFKEAAQQMWNENTNRQDQMATWRETSFGKSMELPAEWSKDWQSTDPSFVGDYGLTKNLSGYDYTTYEGITREGWNGGLLTGIHTGKLTWTGFGYDSHGARVDVKTDVDLSKYDKEYSDDEN